MKLTAHTDGASRGNPGHAGYGFTIEKDGVILEDGFEYIGLATNNVAEYTAFVAALRRMKELGATEVALYSDSQLAVRQINGEYRVKSAGLKPIYTEVMNLLADFDTYEIVHVLRGQNKRADSLANKALDER